jgi:glutathione synthase/RimK-type ligase-like ATP-grasp enzyme
MNGSILLWGCSGDAPLMHLLHELAQRGEPHYFIDERSLHRAHLVCDTHAQGSLQWGTERLELADIAAAYVRPADLRALLRQSPEISTDAPAQRRALATQRQLYAWAEMTTALVVNRPSAASSNDSKPYQLERIRSAGFAVPPTLMTTTPADARKFVARHGAVVCKTAGRTRGITTRLCEADLEHLADVAHCPTQFQAHVAGTDWRVHVIGDAVHACEVHCDADDYRIAPERSLPLQIVPASLPPLIAAHCHSLTRCLGLMLAGIDLRHGADGVWYCFEVNPSPALAYFEQLTGQRLTAALADLLIHAPRRRLH